MRDGWQRVKLGEICELLKRGISPKYVDNSGVEVINQRCIRDHKIDHTLSRRHNTTLKKIPEERLIQRGDVLVNSTGTGTLGRVAQVRTTPVNPATVDSHVTIVRPKKGLFYADFFGYMLIAIEELITQAGEGCGGQTELSRKALSENFDVSFPNSIPEQKRIVAILDEAFDGIAIAQANAEKNLQNAQELFKSHLNSIFSQDKENWQEAPLGSICQVLKRGIAPKYLEEGGMCVLNQKCIRDHRINYSLARRHDLLQKNVPEERFIQKGDVLVNSTGTGTLGRVAQVKAVPAEQTTVDSHITIVRPQSDLFIDDFFGYMLVFIEDLIKEAGEGCGGQTELARKNLAENFRASFPKSHEQQKKAVDVLNSLENNTQNLAVMYTEIGDKLKELKQSLLHQAFSGNL